MFTDEAAEHPVKVKDHAVQVQHLGFDGLAAGKSQQLGGEVGGSLRRLYRVLQVFCHGLPFRRLAQCNLGIAHDGGQQVVEVMGHSTSQPAYCFHLLGLGKLLFQ